MAELPLLLFILLIVAILLRMDFIFYVVYVVAGTYALAQWWAGRSLPHIRVTRRFTDHIFHGEMAQIEIGLENTRWWPIPWLRYDESAPGDLAVGSGVHQALTLRAKEKTSLNYAWVGQRRGHYQIGPGRLTLGDWFGFVESEGLFSEPHPLIIYPRVIPLAQVELASRSPYGTIRSRQPIFIDPTRVIGVRDYRPGDPLRSVDWKSSARTGVLQVKRCEPAVSLTSVIFLDLHPAAYTRPLRSSASEWSIVVAASVANYLIGQRQAVGLASNGCDSLTGVTCWNIPARSGRAHLMKLLEWLARAQLAEAAPLTDWLSTAVVALAWGTTVIVITPSGDETTCRALHRLRRSGLNPALLVTEPYADFGVVQERARRLGVSAHQVAGEHDLKRWQSRPGNGQWVGC